MDNIGAMKAIQSEAFGDKAADKDIRLVYHLRTNVAVFRRDILCMKAGGWMKDEIVNIYMALLQVTGLCHVIQNSSCCNSTASFAMIQRVQVLVLCCI